MIQNEPVTKWNRLSGGGIDVVKISGCGQAETGDAIKPAESGRISRRLWQGRVLWRSYCEEL